MLEESVPVNGIKAILSYGEVNSGNKFTLLLFSSKIEPVVKESGNELAAKLTPKTPIKIIEKTIKKAAETVKTLLDFFSCFHHIFTFCNTHLTLPCIN